MTTVSRTFKRVFDLIVATLLLFVLSPLLMIYALSVRMFLGSPILFRQQRPSLFGEPFTLFKFRTMRDALDDTGHLQPDSEHLKRLGRDLRSSSLDELPELINVLRGDMARKLEILFQGTMLK